MEYIKLFETYVNEKSVLLLEKSIVVGDDLLRKLNKLNKPLANKLKTFLNSNDIKDTAKVSKIEHNDEDGTQFTIIDDKGGERKFKIGKLLKYLGFDTSSVKQYEVDDFLMNFKNADVSDLKEITGEDILKAYNCDNYDDAKGQGGGLHSSCMRFSKSQPFLKIYTSNPKQVSCLVLTNPVNNRVRGRALIWTLDNGERFMDRIYVLSKEMDAIYYKYADDNDIKKDSPSDEVTLENGDEYDHYPYMDTFTQYTPFTGVLSTIGGELTLQSTGGGHSDDNMVTSEYHGEDIMGDEAVFVGRMDDYIYEHDAADCYNPNGDDPIWELNNDDVVEITHVSKHFAANNYNTTFCHTDNSVEIENSGAYVIADDLDIWNYTEWGNYLNPTGFSDSEFNDMDLDDFAIEITYENSKVFEEYLPMGEASSIWSFKTNSFLIINYSVDLEKFDGKNGETYNKHVNSVDTKHLTNTVYLPDSFLKDGISVEDKVKELIKLNDDE